MWKYVTRVTSPRGQVRVMIVESESESESFADVTRVKSESPKLWLETDSSPSPGLESYNSDKIWKNIHHFLDLLFHYNFCSNKRIANKRWNVFFIFIFCSDGPRAEWYFWPISVSNTDNRRQVSSKTWTPKSRLHTLLAFKLCVVCVCVHKGCLGVRTRANVFHFVTIAQRTKCSKIHSNK